MNQLEISSLEFQEVAEFIQRLATDYLSALPSAPTFPPETEGAALQERFGGEWPVEGMRSAALPALRDVLRYSRSPSPRFFGYVLGSGEPVAAAADLLASVVNQNVTAWRSGPAAVTIEHTVVRWLSTALGCAGFHGSLCGGGSSANLMALAMAREASCPANQDGAQPAMVYASEQVHMSIGKALALLGTGRKNLRLLPVDNDFRLVPDELEKAIQHDMRLGRKPMAVVASAGTTNTGAIDPLREIAAIARRHGIWLHVDGAYGALAAIATPEKFAGLELADSLSLDPHKWLYQPLDVGCLLFRKPEAARAAFSHTAAYTKTFSPDPIEGFAFFEESLELSRRFRALKIWLSLRYHGREAFKQAILSDLRHAQLLADLIDCEPRLERVAPVPLSAVCFRLRGESDARQQAVLQRVIQRGRVYISNATIRGQFAMRACFVNHRTTESDVKAIREEVLAAAAEA